MGDDGNGVCHVEGVAGNILYHIKGAAKTELCMLGSKVVECMENMFSILRER